MERMNPTFKVRSQPPTTPPSSTPTSRHGWELPGLTIRWWFGLQFGYFFALFKPDTKEHADPSDTLTIHCWDRGGWHELLSVNEAWHQAWGPSAGQGHVYWFAELGGRLRVFQAKNGPVIGKVFVPSAPANWDSDYPQLKPFFNLSEALSSK